MTESKNHSLSSDIKYQIFLSSPFIEQDIRNKVFNTIHTTGHFPMLLDKQASNSESTLLIIKDEIQASQIYILILGSKYGSVIGDPNDKTSKSFTELEYDIAYESNTKVLVFIQDDVEIANERKELDENSDEILNSRNLSNFHEKVNNHGALNARWSRDNLEDLIAKITTAIHREATILSQESPPKGWVRASLVNQNEVLKKSLDNKIRIEIVSRVNEFTKLDERCFENTDSKKAIAKTFSDVFASIIIDDKMDVYLDSGSTVAYVARNLGEVLKDRIEIDNSGIPSNFISTNNSLAYLHLWLKNQIPCTMFPSGSPEEPYGASYGPISKFGQNPHGNDRAPNYKRTRLDENQEKSISQLCDMFYRPESHQNNKLLIIGAISAIQVSDDYEFIFPDGIDEKQTKFFTQDIETCKGFHVGDYYNMLFKRFLYKTGFPTVICINIEKINAPIRVGICHFVHDPGFPWESFKKEHPLAFCVGYNYTDLDEAVKIFKDQLGLKLFENRIYPYPYQAMIAANEKFLSSISLQGLVEI